jgi:hypothetical protein
MIPGASKTEDQSPVTKHRPVVKFWVIKAPLPTHKQWVSLEPLWNGRKDRQLRQIRIGGSDPSIICIVLDKNLKTAKRAFINAGLQPTVWEYDGVEYGGKNNHA